jgi:hypothetical protein
VVKIEEVNYKPDENPFKIKKEKLETENVVKQCGVEVGDDFMEWLQK